jgi:hypothetical protein
MIRVQTVNDAGIRGCGLRLAEEYISVVRHSGDWISSCSLSWLS